MISSHPRQGTLVVPASRLLVLVVVLCQR